MAYEIYRMLPTDPKNVIVEFTTGMLLWDYIQRQRNRPDRGYSLTRFDDKMNWDISDPMEMRSKNDIWHDNVFSAFGSPFSLLGLMFDQPDYEVEEDIFESWSCGSDLIDKKAATSCFQRLLETFEDEVKNHHCYENDDFTMPTTLEWLGYSSMFDNWLDDLPNGVLRVVFETALEVFRIEDI